MGTGYVRRRLLLLLRWIIQMFLSFIIFRLKTFVRIFVFYPTFTVALSFWHVRNVLFFFSLPFCNAILFDSVSIVLFGFRHIFVLTLHNYLCIIIAWMHIASINHFNNDNSACCSHARQNTTLMAIRV